MIDYLIVGAGIAGATIARVLTDAGKKCLVVDKRHHIAGNCFDYQYDDYYVSQYGGHIFHTNDDGIWQFVNRFSDWIHYEHRVKAFYKGNVYSLPPNLATLSGHIDECKIREMFFAGYSFKQWGMPIDDLPNGILNRIPIRHDYDDRYFTDKWQGVPRNGYTEMIDNMLAGIPVELGTEYERTDYGVGNVIYTGSLDALYDYRYGRLPYRSLRWENEIVDSGIGCATMNYTDYEPGYTRQMEWQYFGHRQKKRKSTMVSTEYPEPFDGTNLRMYPINTPLNNMLHKKYVELAKDDGILFAGRLATYRYLDMHQAIGNAMTLVRSLL